jgi:hypothetical protein
MATDVNTWPKPARQARVNAMGSVHLFALATNTKGNQWSGEIVWVVARTKVATINVQNPTSEKTAASILILLSSTHL